MDDAALADLTELRARLTPGTRVAVLTGAGISAASGIPTFRGAPGRALEPVPARGSRHARGLRARPRTGVALVRLAPRPDRRRRPQRRPPRAGHPRRADRPHARHAERRRLPPAGRQRRGRRVPRLDLARALHRLRPRGPTTAACRCPSRRPARGAARSPGPAWCGSARASTRGVMETAVQAAAACDVFLVVGTAGVVHPAAGLADLARGRGAPSSSSTSSARR